MEKLICQKCEWSWFPRTDRLPAMCPRCKSYDWAAEPVETS